MFHCHIPLTVQIDLIDTADYYIALLYAIYKRLIAPISLEDNTVQWHTGGVPLLFNVIC